jgi:hypothetical protein
MPCEGLKCSLCLSVFPFDTGVPAAMDHFESAHGSKHHLSRDIVYTMALDEIETNFSPRRNGDHYSASMCGGCHRQHVLKRTSSWWLDPMRGYSRMEGTLVHESLKVPYPWEREIEMPESTILGDITVSGVIDRLNRQDRVVRDIKCHGCHAWWWTYPKADEKAMGRKPWREHDTKVYPPGEGESLQVNVLMRLVEAVYHENGYRGEIAAIFLGEKEKTMSNRLFPLDRMDDTALHDRLYPNYSLFKMIMQETNALKRTTMIADMPLAGRHLFNSRDGTCACDLYCDVREACDALLPEHLRL